MSRSWGAAGLLCLGLPSCLARGSTGGMVRPTDDDGGTPPAISVEAGQPDANIGLPPTDPHSVLGIDPPHGPWNGGGLALLRGTGFRSNARVWFGSIELPSSDVVAIDPERLQVRPPPGSAGPIDVTVQNADDVSTRRTLKAGYVYDPFYLEPSSGPSSGGTRVTLRGNGTHWNGDTEVFIDLAPCAEKSLISPTEISCTTPIGTPGSKVVRVRTSETSNVDVLDAFRYGDSDNGYRGGLSGQPLDGRIKVIALDSYTGNPIPGATVIAGEDAASAIVMKTSAGGVATAEGAGLGPKLTVTIAKECFHPSTFVDVPVDTLTVYLDPILSPACGSSTDPPPVGGGSGSNAGVRGEVVWTSTGEFQRTGWTNVPAPESDAEQLVAYVFRLSSDPTAEFQLPPATNAVTPKAGGSRGYAFNFSAFPGNLTLYALAGIETKEPRRFTAYAMGLLRGVSTEPNETTKSVYIPVDVPLDHALTIDLTGPTPTPKGPDRVRTTVAVRVGDLGYALLPTAQRSSLLPLAEPLAFVGVPPLTGSIAGTQYITTARASTGTSDSTPRSVLAQLASTTTSEPLVMNRFVEIPVLEVPAKNAEWNGRDLKLALRPGGASVELTVYEVQSAGNIVNWRIAAPADKTSFRLPDLGALDPALALPSGPLTITVTAAHISSFNYGTLRYRELDRRGWTAYATDVFYAHLP